MKLFVQMDGGCVIEKSPSTVINSTSLAGPFIWWYTHTLVNTVWRRHQFSWGIMANWIIWCLIRANCCCVVAAAAAAASCIHLFRSECAALYVSALESFWLIFIVIYICVRYSVVSYASKKTVIKNVRARKRVCKKSIKQSCRTSYRITRCWIVNRNVFFNYIIILIKPDI